MRYSKRIQYSIPILLVLYSVFLESTVASRKTPIGKAASHLPFFRRRTFARRGGSGDEEPNQGDVVEVEDSEAKADADVPAESSEPDETSKTISILDESSNVTISEEKEEKENTISAISEDNDVDDTNNTDNTDLNILDEDDDQMSITIRERATELRVRGKSLHDEGEFGEAAGLFQQASDTLWPIFEQFPSDQSLSEELATCLLHEALCHLKGQDYAQCIDACTSVLQDTEDSPSVATISAPAIRARAYHRRAKAKLGLEDTAGALQDARSAAFLGDRKGVTLYGRLIRELPPSWGNGNRPLEEESGNPLQSLLSPSPNAALIESLLGKSTGSSPASPFSDLMGNFNPASLLLGQKQKDGDGGSLAKSVLKSLSKRLEDETTQETICQYLKRLNKAQVQNLASMSGMADGAGLSDKQLDRLINFCHGITPKDIRKTVRISKQAIYCIQLLRKVGKVLSQYRGLIVLLIALQWTKSAIRRPLPISKRAARRALT